MDSGQPVANIENVTEQEVEKFSKIIHPDGTSTNW